MSFYYNHPFFTAPAAPPQRRAFGFATPPAPQHPAHPFYASPPTARPFPSFEDANDNEYISLEEEERAAQAHLRSIQRRREEAQAHAAAIAREAAIRAEVEAQARARAQAQVQAQTRARAEREAAIRAELISRIEREAEIQAAIKARQAEEERRKRAYLEAVERRRAEYVATQRQREAIQDAQRRACQQRCQRRLVAPSSPSPAPAAISRPPSPCRCQRQQADTCCADDRSARPTPARAQTPSHQAEWQDFNNMLGSLFGFQLVPDNETQNEKETESQTKTEPSTTTTTTTNTATAVPAPVTPAPVAESSSSTIQAESNKESLPSNFNDLLSQFLGLRVDPLRESDSSSSIDQAKENGNAVPDGLNEFLSRFGLVFEPEQPEQPEEKKEAEKTPAPAAKPAKTAPDAPATTEKKVERPASPASAPAVASSSSAPAQPAAESKQQQDVPPFTSLLGQYTEINPFVRDILGNLEQAFTEELRRKNGNESARPSTTEKCGKRYETECKKTCARKDKGKARADGERKEVLKPTPAPAPTAVQPTEAATPASTDATTESTDSTKSISALNSIESQLYGLQSSFTFPSKLAFAHTTPGDSAPSLLFNKVNSPYHAQAHALLQLLLKADSVSSNGDKDVRRRRKEVVRAVEQEIENLEKKRDGLWEQVKERREKGEESEPEDDGRSWTGSSSSVGDHEHLEQDQEIEHVEEVDHIETSTRTESSENKDKSTEEHKSYADVAKATEGQVEHQAESDVARSQAAESSQQPEESDPVQPEPQGYTIEVTFPAEDDKKADADVTEKNQSDEVEKKSDHSARVEDEEETKEEGYEVL
ncbi:hypothetical protein IAT40_001188 [Kwoniella sp. CBS 6097]